MSMGFIGYVMKNNIKVSEFPCTVNTLADGSQRVTYDAYDFIGVKGLARRNARRLFLTKKTFPITKIFRYSDDWDTLTDRGCISYWDQTSQAQIPVRVLKDPVEYKKVVDKQKTASDVLYYCLAADSLIEQLMTPPRSFGLKDILIPSLLIGGIILTAVMNVYASSQYLQAWGVIKGTTGALGALQSYFQKIGGLPTGMILFPLLGLFAPKAEKPKSKPRVAQPYDNINILIKQKGLITSPVVTQLYREAATLDDGSVAYVDYVILSDKKKRFKLYINTTENYILRGIRNSTIFVDYKQYERLPFRQLSLLEMDMESGTDKRPPINEDMGKVLSKIYQDNINAKAKPASMIAGLTKVLFYAFIFSIIVYSIMFLINIIMEGMALNAFNSASAAINTFISHFGSSSGYRIAPIGNTTTTVQINGTK